MLPRICRDYAAGCSRFTAERGSTADCGAAAREIVGICQRLQPPKWPCSGSELVVPSSLADNRFPVALRAVARCMLATTACEPGGALVPRAGGPIARRPRRPVPSGWGFLGPQALAAGPGARAGLDAGYAGFPGDPVSACRPLPGRNPPQGCGADLLTSAPGAGLQRGELGAVGALLAGPGWPPRICPMACGARKDTPRCRLLGERRWAPIQDNDASRRPVRSRQRGGPPDVARTWMLRRGSRGQRAENAAREVRTSVDPGTRPPDLRARTRPVAIPAQLARGLRGPLQA